MKFYPSRLNNFPEQIFRPSSYHVLTNLITHLILFTADELITKLRLDFEFGETQDVAMAPTSGSEATATIDPPVMTGWIKMTIVEEKMYRGYAGLQDLKIWTL